MQGRAPEAMRGVVSASSTAPPCPCPDAGSTLGAGNDCAGARPTRGPFVGPAAELLHPTVAFCGGKLGFGSNLVILDTGGTDGVTIAQGAGGSGGAKVGTGDDDDGADAGASGDATGRVATGVGDAGRAGAGGDTTGGGHGVGAGAVDGCIGVLLLLPPAGRGEGAG